MINSRTISGTVISSADAQAHHNISQWLSAATSTRGQHIAVATARGGSRVRRSQVSFEQIHRLSEAYARGLLSIGITRELRVLVMIRPGVDFVAVMFALFRIGAVPVLVDPGMGVRRLLECVRGVEPEAFIGIPLAHIVRIVRRGPFRSVKHFVTVGKRWAWGGETLKSFAAMHQGPTRAHSDSGPARVSLADPAAILFTSGSTGPAKGVLYTHGMFDAQIRAIQTHFGMTEGEVDLPGFAPFALFSIAMGMTVVFPDMDFSRPARVDPAKIVRAIDECRPTNATGSPGMWDRVSAHCADRGITLPSLRRVLLFGAPVSSRLIERIRRILIDGADVHTPYGATEALPVSSITGAERLQKCYELQITTSEGPGGSPRCSPQGAAVNIPGRKPWDTDDANPTPERDASVNPHRIAVSGTAMHRGQGLASAGGAEVKSPGRKTWEPDDRPTHQAPKGRQTGIEGPSGTKQPQTNRPLPFPLPYENSSQLPGLCVGRPIGDIEIRIIRITDAPIPNWNAELVVPHGAIGEIVVRGPTVTREYFRLAEANRLAKIAEGDTIWHRMGDVGYVDEEGRFWFCGRKVHRVETGHGTLFSVPCEIVLNHHPNVFRSALVGVGPPGDKSPAIVVELVGGKLPRGRFAADFREELRRIADSNETTRTIRHFLFHRSFPVDVRHNTKINREALAVWAAKRLR